MDSLHFNNKKHLGQYILGFLFIVYIVFGNKLPSDIARLIDTTFGKITLITVFLLLFATSHPILGILGLFVAYKLIFNSSIATGSYALRNYVPTEKKKFNEMTKYNQFPYTLEQEIVSKMAPINNYDSSNNNSYTFNPILNDTYDAAPL
jgi:hypothetical protein